MPQPPQDDDPAPRPGSRSEFARGFERHRQRFAGLARALLRRRPGRAADTDTDELLAQASIDFLTKPRVWRSDSHFVNLFARFLRFAWRDARKRALRDKRGGGEATAALADSPPATAETGPPEAATRRELVARVGAALSGLPDTHRRLVSLRLWEEHSWETIARELDLESADAARMRFARVMASLRDAIDDRPDSP